MTVVRQISIFLNAPAANGLLEQLFEFGATRGIRDELEERPAEFGRCSDLKTSVPGRQPSPAIIGMRQSKLAVHGVDRTVQRVENAVNVHVRVQARAMGGV